MEEVLETARSGARILRVTLTAPQLGSEVLSGRITVGEMYVVPGAPGADRKGLHGDRIRDRSKPASN